MKKLIVIALTWCALLLPALLGAQTFTWTGTTSGAWNTTTNWSPPGTPGAGNTVVINNPAAPHFPELPGDITVTNLTLTDSELDLAGYLLTVTNAANINGSQVSAGSISAFNFTSMANNSFIGSTTLTKTSGGNNTWAGGNTFQDLTLINNDNNYIRMATTNADTYNGNAHFVTTNGYIDVSYTANSTFNGNVTIDASGANGIRFGQNNGQSTIASGFALLTNGYTSTQLILRHLTQNGSAANGTFTPTTFTPTSCIFGGNFTSTSTTATIVACEFRANTNITASNINNVRQSAFSSVSGSTVLTKDAGSNNTWYGGNTFNNTSVLNTSANRTVTMASTAADVFNGTTVFSTANANRINVAYTQGATFNGSVHVNNTGTSGIYFGANNGSATIAAGHSLLTSGYTDGTLYLRNITQSGTTANGSFSPTTFTVLNSTFTGNFTVPSATTISITSSAFNRTNSFEAANISTLTGSSFSATAGTTTLTKLAGGTNTWTGDNTFANTTIINNSTNQLLRLGTTGDDTFNGTTRFEANNANYIQVAYSRNATFNGNVYVDGNSTYGIYFGAASGNTFIAPGYALLTNGFTDGTLSLINVTQAGTTANSTFSPSAFVATNSSFGGNFTINANTSIAISGSTFSRTSSFTADNISTLAGSGFSTTAGSTTFTKTGGTTDTWAGPNTFNNVTIINNSTNVLIRIGTTGASTFNGTTRFVATNANYFQIAYTNNVTFNGNVLLDCTSSNGIFFGTSTGNTTINAGYAMLTNGFTNGTLALVRVTQDGSTANATFNPVTFTATNSTIRGNFTVVASGTTTISGSVFQRTNSFTSATFATMSDNNFSASSGTTTFTKTGNTSEIWAGGNTLYNTTITNNSAAQYIRLAGTNGDSYFGTTYFVTANAATILPAYNLATTFGGNVYLNCTGTGGINMGAGTGLAEIASGYALRTNGYSSNAPLIINELTQLGTAANDSFNVSALTLTGSTIGGSFVFSAPTASLSNNVLSGNNRIYAEALPTVAGNTFSAGANATLITKRGSSNDTWAGNNTFNNTTFRNRSNGRMRLANSNPDVYTGTAIFVQDSTGVIEPAYNGTNSFRGNISINGSTTPVLFALGNGTVVIDGNTAQTILGPASGITIRRLSLMSAGTLTLQTPLTITISAVFAGGKVISDAVNLLIINDNVSVTNANQNSYVIGPVRKIGNDAFTFPLGNGSFYAPIAISAPGNVNDHFTAQYFRTNPHDDGFDTMSIAGTLEMISTREYWMLDRTNGSSSVNVTMSWGAHSSAILDYTALRIARWDGSEWADHGFSNFTGNNAAGTVTTASPVTNFSPFSFGSTLGGGALPVEMTRFTAQVVPEGVQLDWETAIEINNDHYQVERSQDGRSFETIGKVAGMGNTTEQQQYQFIDAAVPAGLVYYRLKQMDFDGGFEYSKTVGVYIKATDEPAITWSMYPNPAEGEIEIIGGEIGQTVGLELVDQHGRSLSLQPLVFGEKNKINVSTLQPGMYVVRIIRPDNVTSQRFIKL